MSSARLPSVQRITYPFDRLYCTTVIGDQVDHSPRYGAAVIAFDGLGHWWVEAISVHSRHFGRPDLELQKGCQLWLAIAVALETTRGDDVAGAINTALEAGAHMALFDEHLPSEPVRRGTPPHVGRLLRRVGAAIAGAASSLVEGARA